MLLIYKEISFSFMSNELYVLTDLLIHFFPVRGGAIKKIPKSHSNELQKQLASKHILILGHSLQLLIVFLKGLKIITS